MRTESTPRKASKQPAPAAPSMQPELDFMDHPIEESFARPVVPMPEPTPKRKRGHPPGSKNKKVLEVDAASRGRLRGRPSKRSKPSGSKIRTDSLSISRRASDDGGDEVEVEDEDERPAKVGVIRTFRGIVSDHSLPICRGREKGSLSGYSPAR